MYKEMPELTGFCCSFHLCQCY